MKEQTSAIVRLQSLPPVFRGSDLTLRFRWTSKTASQYLYLWKRRALVQALGGHSDVYANLLTNPAPDWEQALRAAMPSAMTIGVEALRRAGWSTQVPQRPTVAVNAAHSVFSVAPFEIAARTPGWFETVRTGKQDRTPGQPGLPVLRPAWALADMLRIQDWGHCGLWPDDIERDQIGPGDEADWQAACAAFGLPGTPLQETVIHSR